MSTLFVDVFMLVDVFIYCFLSQEGLIINELPFSTCKVVLFLLCLSSQEGFSLK